VAVARQALARDEGGTFGVRLDTLRWLAVSGSLAYASEDPGVPGFTAGASGLWSGNAPAGVAPANTSLDWAGRRWAMVVLPLPADSVEAARLLIHEGWHAVQRSIVLAEPPNDAGVTGACKLRTPGRELQGEWPGTQMPTAPAASPG